jgi:hypothetical protein
MLYAQNRLVNNNFIRNKLICQQYIGIYGINPNIDMVFRHKRMVLDGVSTWWLNPLGWWRVAKRGCRTTPCWCLGEIAP